MVGRSSPSVRRYRGAVLAMRLYRARCVSPANSNRVVIVQQPDGTYVQQVINVDVNVSPPVMPMPQYYPSERVVEQQPLPPAPQGLGSLRGVFNGDQRWNPVAAGLCSGIDRT